MSLLVAEKEEIVNKFIKTECFEVARGNSNFTEIQLIGTDIFVRVEVSRGRVLTSWLCLEPLRGRLVERRADISDILTDALPDEIAEKIIFNLDVIESMGDMDYV